MLGIRYRPMRLKPTTIEVTGELSWDAIIVQSLVEGQV